MRAVNQYGKKVLDLLNEKAKDGAVTIDNTNKLYMPVHIEIVGEKILSVAHYYEQNGDLVADPEMTFWQGPDGNWYPASITHGGLNIYRESIRFGDDGKITGYLPHEQADEAIFAGQWMKNIKLQQKL